MKLTYNVEDCIDRLEPSVAVDAERQVATRLTATEAHTVAEVMVCEIFLLHRKQLATDVEPDIREGRLWGIGWEDITLRWISN